MLRTTGALCAEIAESNVFSVFPCGGLRDGDNEPRECHGEALRAVAIQLDHHAWRSQARDDKHVFISRRAKRAPRQSAGLLRRYASRNDSPNIMGRWYNPRRSKTRV